MPGTIVAAGELDETGGTWSDAECAWTVALDEVDESEFFTFEVKNGEESTDTVIELDAIHTGVPFRL